ncbi:MAG: hypothetical protein LBM71_04210 [Elusimicrobiota bacterium]|jgi:hypothetical protein|nr:hypothetical protein [Elusimicrobiota bacterium]
MKNIVKDTLKIKRFKIWWMGVAAVVVFLSLPIIFPEDKKPSQSDEEGSALPVAMSTNPLAEYLRKFSKFYGKKNLKKQRNSYAKEEFSYSESDGPMSQEDVLNAFMRGVDDVKKADNIYCEEDFISASSAQVAPYPVLKNGVQVRPDSDGYYYQNEYYQNGTYPDDNLKKSIETALMKYHKAAAAKEGLQAVYLAEPDGSLKVDYVSADYLKNYQANLQASRLGSGANYGGAQGLSAQSGGGNRYGAGDNNALFGDMSKEYAEISDTIRQTQAASATQEDNNQNADKGKEKAPEQLLLEVAPSARRFREPDTKANLPKYNREVFGNAPMFLDGGKRNTFLKYLERYGISGDDIMQEYIPVSIYEDAGADFQKKLPKDENGDTLPFKIFSLFNGRILEKNLQEKGGNGQNDFVFVNYMRTPYSDTSAKHGPENFSTVFYERTGLKDMLNQMQVDPAAAARLDYEYRNLDKTRNQNAKEIAEKIKKNPELKNLIPSITYVLGKSDDGSGIKVATPKSYLYTYSPFISPKWINEKFEDTQHAYLAVAPKELTDNLKIKGNMAIVTDKKVADILEKEGVQNVLVISNQDLASYTPQSIDKVLAAIKGGLAKELDLKKLSESSVEKKKEKLVKDMKKIDKQLKQNQNKKKQKTK